MGLAMWSINNIFKYYEFIPMIYPTDSGSINIYSWQRKVFNIGWLKNKLFLVNFLVGFVNL